LKIGPSPYINSPYFIDDKMLLVDMDYKTCLNVDSITASSGVAQITFELPYHGTMGDCHSDFHVDVSLQLSEEIRVDEFELIIEVMTSLEDERNDVRVTSWQEAGDAGQYAHCRSNNPIGHAGSEIRGR